VTDTPSPTSAGAIDSPAVQRQVLGRAAGLLADALDFRDTLRQIIAAWLPALSDFGFFDVVHQDVVLRAVAGEVGIWDWDMVSRKVAWSDRVYRMHEMAPGSDTGGYEGFRQRIHPDDRPAIEASMNAALGWWRWRPGSTNIWASRSGSTSCCRSSAGCFKPTPDPKTSVLNRKCLNERHRLHLAHRAGPELAGRLDPAHPL
jgi:hypothetical protein